MTSRACRLGPFERLPPVLGETLSLGDVGPTASDEPGKPRAVRAPIVIVDAENRQASVVHSKPLGILKRGRSFLFSESQDEVPRFEGTPRRSRDARREADDESDDDSVENEEWVTLVGAPPSLFGDVVYEALTSPWAAGSAASTGLLLKGRLEATPAGSATLFGEWPGPGASVAAELSKKSLDAVAAEHHAAAAPAPATASAPAPASASAAEYRGRRRGRDRGRSAPPERATPSKTKPASDDEIFFITDDK